MPDAVSARTVTMNGTAFPGQMSGSLLTTAQNKELQGCAGDELDPRGVMSGQNPGIWL